MYLFESIIIKQNMALYDLRNVKKMSIGKHIREYRKKAGLTQKELAEKSNIAEITIRQYESGKRTPNSEKLKNIANVLQISPSLLMGIDSSKFDKQINLAEVQQELSKDTYIKNYFQTLGFTITTNVTKWHWENDSKEHQIVDQLEYILSKDNDSIAISVQEFEELQLRTKEVIEGVFYKKLIQEKKN